MVEEVAELNRIRLDDDLTLEALADQIGGVDASTLQRLFADPDRKPFERTLHKIRKFLTRRAAAKPRRQRVAS